MTGAPLPFDQDAGQVLSNDEMREADRLTIAGGIAGITLMEAAGRAVARFVMLRWNRRPVLVLCGPGNNGGDGYVAARHLKAAGWPVTLAALGTPKAGSDAALAAADWDSKVAAVAPSLLETHPLVIDALFGAGLARAPEGPAQEIIAAINRLDLDCVGVDVPSGVDGDSGRVLGEAPRCRATVTFFRLKPGHLLLPGRALAGEIHLADIGIHREVLAQIKPRCARNDPALWRALLHRPRLEDHKYKRGHLLVIGGGVMTGAGRLAARAARRAGAGMVTLVAPPATLPIYAADQPGLITLPLPEPGGLAGLMDSRRISACVIGPGGGVGEGTRDLALAVLATGRPCVLDADGLTSFAGKVETLTAALRGPLIVTPHDGEFARLFPDLTADQGKLARARAAAARLGGIVLFKGADSVIAAPDGRAVINDNAPPDLASAGTGDVLAGICGTLLAQGMPAFEAAAAAVWLHGAAGAAVGRGLIAEDLPEALPKILAKLEA
ncbi:bifunctional NAD(P)H-hydrate repair enzyme [Hypericibacter adhaerens]|uniref:Bifunctional NAD(P)H-hydrate repair enzyme n=1 Tax=Hypericibacter adhaerens TaxID=2602016 RepID=A0A5J6MXH6_9PROT|nr:NAD(P)H-hydrate dehydratase [Hypericibacter adhaerens]QEX22378.1 bifunctional NAD(P)H-hydrate repair enzyme [Hypericibacter adhaerens]